MKLSGRRAPAVLALLLTGGLVAACGSASSTTTTSAASGAAASTGGAPRLNRAAFRQCLAQHGVTLPARPRAGSGGPPPGGGFFGGGGNGGQFRADPKVRAAIQACGGGNFRRGRRFQISRAAVTKYAACVRQHGYNLPNPNFSGKGPVFPAGIRSDPKFQAASKSCQALLFPGRGVATAASRA